MVHVVAYTVGQRTGEIGLRLALGASRGAILGWLIAASLRVSLTGAAIGLGAGVLLAGTLRRFLFETSPADALTLGVVAAILIVAALLASLAAARRALSIDPAIALQS